ncbi:hypothetical protein B484DRAFT_419428 [Ochromonadaceae sp. CCMP2298]|nr:hypothetical protein B484DRAFT_419428 [Ochromonadaceae sp. CCMP2298]
MVVSNQEEGSEKGSNFSSDASPVIPLPRGWDPRFTNPMFFGYTTQSVEEHEAELQGEKDELALREGRAIERAMSTRGTIIDALEKAGAGTTRARLEKIELLESKYADSRRLRDEDFKRQQKEMIPSAFAIYERQFMVEAQTAELALEREVGKMRRVHEEKVSADVSFLGKRREEMEAFKDAGKQSIPAAERLEEFARVEVGRSIEELEKVSVVMEKMRLEYREMKMDFDAVVGELEALQEMGGVDKAKTRKMTEMRSMVSVAETRMREAQRHVQEGLDGLMDAEVLLDRAVRLVRQQGDLLPLFKLIACDQGLPSHCRLNALVMAMVMLMQGSFDQKYTTLFRLFDNHCEGKVSLSFCCLLLSGVQASLHLLTMMPTVATKQELENAVQRGFLSLKLDPETDLLTEFELKDLTLHLVSHSHLLTKVLGLTNASEDMASYQRTRMSPLALLQRGMIDQNTAKLRIHMDRVQYRAQLQPAHKARMHEHAMAMGQEDPLRADYSKFMVKVDSAESYKVPPLDNGHLLNLQYLSAYKRRLAAEIIQAWFRSRHDRRMAELAARHMAFVEAKSAAMTAMKSKVVREFKKREEGAGMGKMKWDAQVRMRQAKLRTQGQGVSRSDTVMIMMEEAIAMATGDIEARFQQLEAKEEFSTFNFDRTLVKDDPARELLDVAARFGLLLKPSIGDRSMLADDKQEHRVHEEEDGGDDDDDDTAHFSQSTAKILSPLQMKRQREEEERQKKAGGVGKEEEARLAAAEAAKVLDAAEEQKKVQKRKQLTVMDQEKVRAYLQGQINTPPSQQELLVATPTLGLDGLSGEPVVRVKGENEMDRRLRLLMASPEPAPQYLEHRLRALNISVTRFKVGQLLGEIPSKRLLLRYLGAHSDEELVADLTARFKFKSRQLQFVQHLRRVASSDLEAGTIRRHMMGVQLHSEAGILDLFESQMGAFEASLVSSIERRMGAKRKLKEEAVVEEELARVDGFVQKFQGQCVKLLASIDLLRSSFSKASLSFYEVERKRSSIHRYKLGRAGLLDPTQKQVPLELRQNWVLRVNEAAKQREVTPQQRRAKYCEIRNVCREFLDTAVSDAVVVVNEIFQPRFRKTIPVAQEFTVDGRAESGRGIDGGKWYVYVAHNIEYRVALDYDGVFNGSDEYAAKAAGKDRLGAQEYFKLQLDRLQCPLMATVDFQGFRVLCTSKLPVQNVLFSDEGEVAKMGEDLVYGVQQRGDSFVNKSKVAQTYLKIAATSLNLAEHLCRGSKDISASSTAGSSELKIYKGLQEEFYVKDFWLAFPPEAPDATPHLRRTARDQSVFWRQLRPEFVKRCREPLSPDACGCIVYGTSDSDEHFERVRAASDRLVQVVLPQFLESLLQREYIVPLSEGLGLDLTSEMHAQGVNIRHLGLMRYKLWRPLPGVVSFFYHERCFRSSQDLRQELANGDSVSIGGKTYTVQEGGRRSITHSQVPILETYIGDSANGLIGRVGSTRADKQCFELRLVLLAEMLSRTIKNVVRLQMRAYNEQYKVTSTQLFAQLVVEYLNVLSGSSASADQMLRDMLVDGVRERFGEVAVQPSEEGSLLRDLQPVLSYLVNRVIAMLGVRLSLSCESEFHERPVGFVFIVADVLEVLPVTKHNIPLLPFADAMIVSLAADATEQEAYTEQVLRDQPSVFLLLSERKGARLVSNKGMLGDAYSGTASRGCELEHPGPVPSDRFVRSMAFRPNAKSYVDVKHHELVVPPSVLDSFSVELFFMVQGGRDMSRTMLMSGRYAVLASRDNMLVVVFIEGLHEIHVKLCPLVMDVWVHLCVTYDGTTLRCYMDSVLTKAAEVDGILLFKQQAREAQVATRRADMHSAEAKEAEEVRQRARLEAAEFYMTKDGVTALKRLTALIMESDAFQAENIAADAKDQSTALKERRSEGLKRAKVRYLQERQDELVGEIRVRYQIELADYEALLQREARDAAERVNERLRIGSETPNSHSVDGSHIFYGRISCVSVYPSCLAADRVKDRYLCAVLDRRLDAQRLHGIAASKFELAMKQGPPEGNSSILRNYARSLCSYLRIQAPDSMSRAKTAGKMKLLDMIHQFKGMRLSDAIAEILREIPLDAEHADIVATGFLSIREVDGSFFSRSQSLQRKDLVHLPFDFALTSPESPPEHWEAAAYIFKEVVREMELMYVYGDLDLRWLPEIQSAPLVISLVKAAMEDKKLKVVRMAELFRDAGLNDTMVTDSDVQVMAQNLSICEGFDLSHCPQLTNATLQHVDRMSSVKVLCLDYCHLITDDGFRSLRQLHAKLTVLSIEGLSLISDEGFGALTDKCTQLQQVNVNKCPNVSHETIRKLVKQNPRLSSLKMSSARITDEALSLIAAGMVQSGCGAGMLYLDISMCADLTDLGVICIAETCPALLSLNMRGLSRVSDLGTRSVCSNCWHLQHLDLEDVFLLRDDAFWFSPLYDGRQAANENMLMSLSTLTLTDCSNLTDRGVQGLAERCRKLDALVLRGCDKITDQALQYMSNPTQSTASAVAMCDSIHRLNLAYATGLTGLGIMGLLSACSCLEDLDLSGLAPTVTDAFVQTLSRACPTLQRLAMQKCLLLTDAALCSLADNLWLERLDVSGCHKMTDAGFEVLSEACSGLRCLVARKVKRLGNRTLFSLLRNCQGLQRVEVQDCPLVTRAAVDEVSGIKAKLVLEHSL